VNNVQTRSRGEKTGVSKVATAPDGSSGLFQQEIIPKLALHLMGARAIPARTYTKLPSMCFKFLVSY